MGDVGDGSAADQAKVPSRNGIRTDNPTILLWSALLLKRSETDDLIALVAAQHMLTFWCDKEA